MKLTYEQAYKIGQDNGVSSAVVEKIAEAIGAQVDVRPVAVRIRATSADKWVYVGFHRGYESLAKLGWAVEQLCTLRSIEASGAARPTPAQEKALDEMVADAQRLGLYDMPNPATKQQAEPWADKRDAWEYSFIHSSATGRPAEKVGPCLTYDRSQAFGVGCIEQREVRVIASQSGERAGDPTYVDSLIVQLLARSASMTETQLRKLHDEAAQMLAMYHGLVSLQRAAAADTAAARDVLTERKRQATKEGWTTAHDDAHKNSDLALAAAAYALHVGGQKSAARITWPQTWSLEWFKPTAPRRDLVKAGALILAEIERLDRAAVPTHEAGHA